MRLPRHLHEQGFTYRLCFLPEELVGEEFGDDEWKALKGYTLYNLAMGKDVALFKDGEEVVPSPEVLQQAREVVAQRA